MSQDKGHFVELTELLEALCDDRLSPAQSARLEQLVLSDPGARRLYLEYIDLHGTLYWDTAIGADEPRIGADGFAGAALAASASSRSTAYDTTTRPPSTRPPSTRPPSTRPPSTLRRRSVVASAAAVAAVVVIGLTLFVQRQFFGPERPAGIAVDSRVSGPEAGLSHNTPANRSPSGDLTSLPLDSLPAPSAGDGVAVDRTPPADGHVVAAPNPSAVAAHNVPLGDPSAVRVAPVQSIDEQLAAGWTLGGVEPSPPAEDSEWLRRVYLDVTGRIPPADDVERFLKDRRPDKRSLLVDELLDDPHYVVHWTTIWTNLLVGRGELPDGVSRSALERFLRRSFAENRPWSDVVFELVAAEGDNQENGATNFLLAHLNNEAVPATAVTSRLFLGTQVQCTQCHNHPFNDTGQNHFWELNSCFQQTAQERGQKVDAATGQSRPAMRLVNRPVDGPIFYENRQNLMLAALPKFSGVAIDPDASTNRRRELARLMVTGEQTQVALATVNRTWQHFFGYGFTNPVDDMGPHNPATHPALLDHLAREFVASGYDVKQLIRWICNSQAYQLSSRSSESNAADNPEAGEPPLFTRVYVKPMSVEQLYDSLLVATRLDVTRGSRWDEAGHQQRQEWLQQFVIAYQTEENDEAVTFDGTLPQALMMMNGDLVQQAVSAEGDTYLRRVAAGRGTDAEKIRKLYLAALSRNPTPKELATFRKLLRDQTAARGGNRQQAQAEALQDLLWAFLNSSEFILIH